MNWQPFEELILQIEGRVPLNREIISPKALTRSPRVTCLFDYTLN